MGETNDTYFIPTKKFVDFVVDAYKLPDNIQQVIKAKYKDNEDRCISTLFLITFSYYIYNVTGELVEPDPNALDVHSDKFDKFLANAVVLTYCQGIDLSTPSDTMH